MRHLLDTWQRFYRWLTFVEPRHQPSRDASRDRTVPGKQRIRARRSR
jgi:hypothetical protein